jgi:hypothetical protein
MIVAVMQPYFFPYIGYFQLMRAVDVFVLYDDVQYMKGGWINRNLIRIGNAPAWLTLPVHKASISLPINQRQYQLDESNIQGTQRRLQAAYAKVPGYEETAAFVDGLLAFPDPNVAAFNANLLEQVARRLAIGCRFVASSSISKPAGLKGEARLIDLCARLGASHYVNSIGGLTLYDAAAFAEAGLELRFLSTISSPSFLESGMRHLSIIDGLMREGFGGTAARLEEYELISP